MEKAKLPNCPKCGCEAVSSQYQENPQEFLRRTCAGCGYVWKSPTLDRLLKMTHPTAGQGTPAALSAVTDDKADPERCRQ